MNAFYITGKLDRQYMRIAACYRLLRRGVINPERAIDLLAERRVDKPRRLVELWLSGYSFRQLRAKGMA